MGGRWGMFSAYVRPIALINKIPGERREGLRVFGSLPLDNKRDAVDLWRRFRVRLEQNESRPGCKVAIRLNERLGWLSYTDLMPGENSVSA